MTCPHGLPSASCAICASGLPQGKFTAEEECAHGRLRSQFEMCELCDMLDDLREAQVAAEVARADLTAAREENERLRAVVAEACALRDEIRKMVIATLQPREEQDCERDYRSALMAVWFAVDYPEKTLAAAKETA